MLIYLISPSYESSSVCAYLRIYFSFALPLMHLSYVNRKPLLTIKARFCQIRSKHCSNSIDNYNGHMCILYTAILASKSVDENQQSIKAAS